jgi:thiamine biosynthesis protein ThiS
MKLFLNGEAIETPEGVTIDELLRQLAMPEKGVAVERNREIVPKSLYSCSLLTEGDRLEIVQFVGGG